MCKLNIISNYAIITFSFRKGSDFLSHSLLCVMLCISTNHRNYCLLHVKRIIAKFDIDTLILLWYYSISEHISYVPDVVYLPRSWSLQLCGFLYFPPLRTVHAAFVAHGVPSTNPRRLETITSVLITSTIIAATSAFQHRFGCLLFFVSLHPC